MASEASRSSNAADSYIGSLISLISKFEIRYEGTLHDINTQESSIGLTDVRSYGSEERKKDGQQVPASDKVYGYILFRGSDIKDLQVKASPPVQNLPPVDDPAIIRSQYSRPPSVSTSLPYAGSRPVADPSSHSAQIDSSSATFQGGIPLYQPGGSLSWGTSPLPSADGSGHAMPMYWQGFYGPSNGLSHSQQQSLFQPSLSLSMPHTMQQPIYPGISAPILTGSSILPGSNMPAPPYTGISTPVLIGSSNLPASSVSAQNLPASNVSRPNLPVSNIRELASPLLPPFNFGSINLTSSTPQSTIPPQSAVLASDSSPSLFSNVDPSTALQNVSLPLVSRLTNSGVDINGITVPGSMPKTAPIPPLPQSVPANVGTFRSNHSETSALPLVTPGQLFQPESSTGTLATRGHLLQPETSAQPLVTPGQLFQPDLNAISSSVSSVPVKKDVEVVQAESSKHPPSAPVNTQAPLLPLPSPVYQKMNGPPFQTHHSYTSRGHERGRGNRISRPDRRFTEDFNFTAMNEKFKKDEIWGDLGKANKTKNRDNIQKDNGGEFFEDGDDKGSATVEKPVYVKDDFFDSLSCDSLDNGQRNGTRHRFSEQRKVNGETFGDFPKHRGGRGGRWPGRGGHSRGSYYGRGYGYVGRGQAFY